MSRNTTENNKSVDNNTARSMGNYGNDVFTNTGVNYVSLGIPGQLISSIQVLSGDITVTGKQIAKGNDLKEQSLLAAWSAVPMTAGDIVLPNINECVIAATTAVYIVYYG